MNTTIIGIDCATIEKKTGLACGTYDGRSLRVESVTLGSADTPVLKTILGWMDSAPNPESILIAIDAPLGWPTQLGKSLQSHQAGDSIDIEPNALFRRGTDRFIKQRIGKQPLDVGADRIARTAHKALEIISNIRDQTGIPLSLAWNTKPPDQPAAIEVYPAATLLAHRLETKGYKGAQGDRVRAGLLEFLSDQVDIPVGKDLLVANDDAFDALVCLLAGVDFLRGEVYQPRDLNLAKREGWIWVRRKR